MLTFLSAGSTCKSLHSFSTPATNIAYCLNWNPCVAVKLNTTSAASGLLTFRSYRVLSRGLVTVKKVVLSLDNFAAAGLWASLMLRQ